MIRAATPADIPTMLQLGEAMHAESRYARHPWNTAKVEALIAGLIESPDGLALVAERDGALIGGFLGSVDEHYFTNARQACDFALFVSPDRRGALTGKQLLAAYVAWARERGADMIQLGITTGVKTEATTMLAEACGFERVGALLEQVAP